MMESFSPIVVGFSFSVIFLLLQHAFKKEYSKKKNWYYWYVFACMGGISTATMFNTQLYKSAEVANLMPTAWVVVFLCAPIWEFIIGFFIIDFIFYINGKK